MGSIDPIADNKEHSVLSWTEAAVPSALYPLVELDMVILTAFNTSSYGEFRRRKLWWNELQIDKSHFTEA